MGISLDIMISKASFSKDAMDHKYVFWKFESLAI